MIYKQALAFAREMRKNQTPAEQFFWEKVRNRKILGKKFNRQFIIEHARIMGDRKYFIVDFYCHEKQLIVEIDGKIHLEQVEYDRNRTAILEEMNYTLIRFENEAVLNSWNQVEIELKKYLI